MLLYMRQLSWCTNFFLSVSPARSFFAPHRPLPKHNTINPCLEVWLFSDRLPYYFLCDKDLLCYTCTQAFLSSTSHIQDIILAKVKFFLLISIFCLKFKNCSVKVYQFLTYRRFYQYKYSISVYKDISSLFILIIQMQLNAINSRCLNMVMKEKRNNLLRTSFLKPRKVCQKICLQVRFRVLGGTLKA